MRGARWWVRKAGVVLLLVVGALALLSLVVMLLWNVLMPELFHAPRIGFWQAGGLLVLSRILLGGWRGRSGRWRAGRLRERWRSMTPEERERLRERLGRCGWGPAAPDATEPPRS